MNYFSPAVALCAALAASPCLAESRTDSVVLLLRTYTSTWSADEPCLHAGPTEADVTTLRLNCPSTVRVEAQADEAAGWHMDHQQMAAGPFVLNHYRLSHAGTPSSRAAPLQLLLSW